MATVTIEVKQVRTVLEGPLYQVDTSVILAQNIEQEIFVFATVTDVFDHVATVWDIANYPPTKEQATLTGAMFYRKAQAVVPYENENTAVEAAAYTLNRIRTLVNKYQTVNDEFIGTDTYIFTGNI